MDTFFDPTTPDPDTHALIAARPHLRMHAMDGLMFEGVPLNAIAQKVGTPTWVIGAQTLRTRARRLRHAFDEAGLNASVHYAVKANDHLAILKILANEGLGADVVSGGEMARALAAGMNASHIVFSGVGKTDDELRHALSAGIAQINVESAEELERLSAIASAMGAVAPVVLRVNPDVDAHTHAKITTGLATNKFGISWSGAARLYAHAATLPGLRARGFAVHIGSQITTAAPFRAAFSRIATLVRDVRAAGQNVELVDCGGGLGITYRDETEGSPTAFAGAIKAELGALDVRLAVEPGRWIVGPAGILLSSVVTRKNPENEGGAPFLIVDAAMNDLLRPSLYEAWHGIVAVNARDAHAPVERAHVVGPVCESGDSFGYDRLLPHMQAGALVAFLDTGAYGAVMSSTYNARPLAAQVLVDDEQWSVIRERQTVAQMWEHEHVPSWLG